jgi:hypothetical protein
MIYSRPFTTKRFIAYAGDSRRRDLSLAVRVVDAFTERAPQVLLRVSLKELPDVRPLRSASGVFCFEGRETVTSEGVVVTRVPIPDGNYTLVVEPDPTGGNWFYLQPAPGDPWTNSFERPITLPLADPPLPDPPFPTSAGPLPIMLAPRSPYPFPANATLVRGIVTQGGPDGVAHVVVSSTYEQVDPADTTQTVFKDVETQTDREGEFVLFFKKLPLRTQQITVTASKDGDQVQEQVLITEGTTLKDQVLDLP